MITEPTNKFWEAIKSAGFPPPDEPSQQILSAMASLWRTEENYFAAGYAMEQAMRGAWGDPEKMYSYFVAAVQDFENCVNSRLPEPYPNLAALLKLNSLLGQASWMFGVDTRIKRENVLEELGQRLISYYQDSPNKAGYLVTGINLKTDLASYWEPIFPQFEVMMGVEQSGGGFLTLNLPSAFQIFVMLGDYEGAQTVIRECSEAFTTPGLRGWKAVVQAYTTPLEAVERFAEAADAFAEDHPDKDDMQTIRRSWSSINVDLWAKFFRSKSAFALAIRNPQRVKELIAEAADALQGTESGWHDTQVSKYGILVKYLAHLIGQEPGLTPEEAKKEYLLESRVSGEEKYDPVAMRFLTLSSESFEGFRVDPAQEITSGKLRLALDALAQIPLIGPELTKAVTPEL